MANSEGFPAANAEKELNPGQNKDFQVDSVSSDIATSKDLKVKIKIIYRLSISIFVSFMTFRLYKSFALFGRKTSKKWISIYFD